MHLDWLLSLLSSEGAVQIGIVWNVCSRPVHALHISTAKTISLINFTYNILGLSPE